jgi:DNA-binding SARP family transcriptional activator
VGAPHIFSEKIRRPTHVGLRRERLERTLLDPSAPGLTLVCAPAGSGKSTLLASMASAAEVEQIPVAWYRVTSDEASPDAFVAHLSAALGSCLPITSTNALDDLLSALDGARTPCLLVLDDVHEIVATPAERALDSFLSLRPHNLRVAMGSRRPPDINLPRLRATDAIREVTSDDLRFRVWEVEELFTTVHGAPLSPETAAALTRRTGGWAAGLQLFYLATSGKSAPARQQAVAALGPRTRLIRSYLARNVLDELDDTRRRFLVDTCALGLLTGPLCDELLGAEGSAAVLEALERDQLFTTSVDDGLTYRYHEVLQRHLELALVTERGVDGARRWYARCGKLLEAAGADRDALRAYALAEDWLSVARLVRRCSAEVTTAISAEADGLLPTALLQDDPWLALAEARRRLRRGAVAHAVMAYRHAETLLDEPHFRDTCVAERLTAAAWLPDRPGGETDAWTDRLRALTRGAERSRLTPARAFGEGALIRAVEALLAADFDLAATRFADAALTAPEGGLPRLAAQLGAVVADLATGRGSDCDQRLEELTLDAAFAGYPWIERLCRGLMAASLAVSSGASWRLETCSELMTECDRDGDRWGAALLEFASAVAAGTVGDESARRLFDLAAARFRALDAPRLATCTERAARLLLSRDAPIAPHAEVEVHCLGRFEIVAGAHVVDLTPLRPRAQMLLQLLAVQHDRPVHRERLIDALWPGATLAVGTRRLQVAVSSIRQVLAPCFPDDAELVRRTGDNYRLALPGAVVDVQAFDAALATAAAERDAARRIALRRSATERYLGDLLPESGSAEHVVGERERLRLAAASACCALAQDLLASGEFGEAAGAARRSVELDRYQDSGWQLLADALTASGDETAAARTRLEHVHLRAELEGNDVADTSISTPRAAVERTLSAR